MVTLLDFTLGSSHSISPPHFLSWKSGKLALWGLSSLLRVRRSSSGQLSPSSRYLGHGSIRAPSLEMVLKRSSDTQDLCPTFLPLVLSAACQVPQRKFPSILFSESPRAIFSLLGRRLPALRTQVPFSSVINRIGAGQLREPGKWPRPLNRGSLLPKAFPCGTSRSEGIPVSCRQGVPGTWMPVSFLIWP